MNSSLSFHAVLSNIRTAEIKTHCSAVSSLLVYDVHWRKIVTHTFFLFSTDANKARYLGKRWKTLLLINAGDAAPVADTLGGDVMMTVACVYNIHETENNKAVHESIQSCFMRHQSCRVESPITACRRANTCPRTCQVTCLAGTPTDPFPWISRLPCLN